MTTLGGLEPHWVWLIVAMALGIAEIFVPGVFLIWLAAAAGPPRPVRGQPAMNPGDLEPHWLWLIGATLLGIAEILVPGVFLIWLAAAAALTGLAAMVFGLGAPFQFMLFALLAIGSVYWGRRWYNNNPVESSDPLLNDRAARLIGQTVVVADDIRHGRGRVRIGDGVWEARGADVPAGATVRVTGAHGTCLTVEPVEVLKAPEAG